MLIPVALTTAKQIPEKKDSRKMLALLALGNTPGGGGDILADSLRNELSIISRVPVIEVARSAV